MAGLLDLLLIVCNRIILHQPSPEDNTFISRWWCVWGLRIWGWTCAVRSLFWAICYMEALISIVLPPGIKSPMFFWPRLSGSIYQMRIVIIKTSRSVLVDVLKCPWNVERLQNDRVVYSNDIQIWAYHPAFYIQGLNSAYSEYCNAPQWPPNLNTACECFTPWNAIHGA